MTEVLYPGSFDPVTNGHIDVILRLRKMFGNVVVLVTESTSKKYLFTIEERIELIKSAIGNKKGVEVTSTQVLTTQFAKARNMRMIARSVRSSSDWEYEYALAEVNKKLAPEIETVFLLADSHHSTTSSSIVREIAAYGGDTSPFVSEEVSKALKRKSTK